MAFSNLLSLAFNVLASWASIARRLKCMGARCDNDLATDHSVGQSSAQESYYQGAIST